jgi:phosphoglycolate phosphatase-like HAD superfamily hydrolase
VVSARIAILFDIDGTLLITDGAVVGDTPNDIEGAHAAGRSALPWPATTSAVAQLREAGADDATGSLEEALPL